MAPIIQRWKLKRALSSVHYYSTDRGIASFGFSVKKLLDARFLILKQKTQREGRLLEIATTVITQVLKQKQDIGVVSNGVLVQK